MVWKKRTNRYFLGNCSDALDKAKLQRRKLFHSRGILSFPPPPIFGAKCQQCKRGGSESKATCKLGCCCCITDHYFAKFGGGGWNLLTSKVPESCLDRRWMFGPVSLSLSPERPLAQCYSWLMPCKVCKIDLAFKIWLVHFSRGHAASSKKSRCKTLQLAEIQFSGEVESRLGTHNKSSKTTRVTDKWLRRACLLCFSDRGCKTLGTRGYHGRRSWDLLIVSEESWPEGNAKSL